MKKFCSIIVITICCFSAKSQLTGNAFLSGQTNHSGIKVKFNAHPNTAVTDSTYTSPTGTYSINITGGVYDVVFSKSGYLISNYNNGNTVVLTNTVVLNNDTLLPGNQVNVSGNVSGNWTNNNTYIVNGDIIVRLGDTLTIQPGTIIKFNGNYSILDTGVLKAVGTVANPILFTSNLINKNAGDWNRIEIYNSGTVFNHCVLEYSTYGFYMYSPCSPIITENEIRFFNQTGIYCVYASPVISKNWIHDFNYIFSSIGIWCVYNPPMTIECNKIHDGFGYGIRPLSTIQVKNNIIYNINGSSRGFGIELEIGQTEVSNNYIHNCNTGIIIGENNTLRPIVTNNTITNNTTGISVGTFGGSYGNETIINNILTNNQCGISQNSSYDTISNLSYNLVWNNSGSNYCNIQITGIGQIVGTNSQGNPIDSYYNMSQDPLFVGGVPPVLSPSSPCINAGDITYSHNIGFDTSYTCSSIINSINSYSKQNDASITVYPNPTSGILNIETQNKNVEIRITNLIGEEIIAPSAFGISPTGEKTIDVSILQNGIYFVSVKTSEGLVIKKIIIQH